MATNIKSYEKDTLVDILKSKILLYKNIIKKTYLCYKGFIANNIFKTHELNQGINELESIQELLLGIHSEIEAEEDMENTGSHAKDELNTKTEDGRVLGISIINSGEFRHNIVIYSQKTVFG